VARRKIGSIVASKYRLDAELGRGGMGVVYRAHHLRVHKDFAIKVLLTEVSEHRTILSRFMLEAQAAGRIGHPGILDVYDVGEDEDGAAFIVMELLRGEALATLLRREKLELDAACWIAIQVLDVLEAAHKAGVVHRDVKPQNVFITVKEQETELQRGVKLLDFGIAKFAPRTSASGGGAPASTPQEDVQAGADDSVAVSALTRSGEIIGSPLYMAPEQAKGEPDLDARADVWSVGAMLFEMLTGKCAHAATTPVAVLAKILTEPAPLASTRNEQISPELDAIVQKALKIERAERYKSASEMREAIALVRKSLGTADRAPALPRPSEAPAPANPAPSSPAVEADLGPGVVTSTLAAPPPTSAKRKSVTTDDPPLESAVTKNEPARAAQRTSRIVAIVALVAGVGIAVPWVLKNNENGKKALIMNDLPAAASSSLPVVVATTPTTAMSPSAPAASASEVPSAAAPSVSTSAAPARTATAPPTQQIKCEAHEVLSHGHCCARGLEWQNGKCERPLATTF
jgi:eukaryotic-like serine/threonine-protein kinase